MSRPGWSALALSLGAALWAGDAWAFHSVDSFSDGAAIGGGSNIYYTGSPRFRGWTCTACHLDAPQDLLLNVSSEPAGLLLDRVYVPDTAYTITVAFASETRGLEANANYNTFAAELVDGEGSPVGGFFGFDENLMKTTPAQDVLFARGQKNVQVTAWTFKWQAPAAGTGYLDLYLAAVDGNGADSATEASDPLGDDVSTGVLRLAEEGVPAPPLTSRGVTGAGCAARPGAELGWLVALGAGLLWARRSRRR
jgi:hypothetical protein